MPLGVALQPSQHSLRAVNPLGLAKPSKAREGGRSNGAASSQDLSIGTWLCPANTDYVTCIPYREDEAGPSLVLA